MDLASLTQLLRRQWMIVGLIMALSWTSAYLTWTNAAPSFRANATLSILPPRVNVEGVPRNPYLDIAAASNADIAQRMSIQVNGTSWRRRLTDEGFSPDYLVDHGDGTSPVLRVNVETDRRAVAVETLDAVIDAVDEELSTEQERFEIEEASRFTLDVLDKSDGAARIYGNRTRLTGAVVVLGAAAAVVAAQLLDNLQRRRREKAEAEAAAPAAAIPNSTPPAVRTTATGSPVATPAGTTDDKGIWIPAPRIRRGAQAPRPQVGDQDNAAAVTAEHNAITARTNGGNATPTPEAAPPAVRPSGS